MIEGLKPYGEYQTTNLPWLNRIPIRWQVLRGKGVFTVIDVRSDTGMEEKLTVSASDGVVPRRTKTVTMFMAKSYVGHKLCWPGDFVVNSLWAWMQGLGTAKHHGLISSAYSVYRPRKAYSEYGRFFHYLIRSAAYKWELLTRSKGVWISRLQLLDLAFMDMPILLPPPDEQAAIVRFLDHANQRIDRFIRTKKKVIALLNEQKQAIIHRAVTRGIDPNVKMKDSGIPWLGEIPEHWGISRIKTKFQCLNQRRIPLNSSERGMMKTREYDYYGASGVIDKVDNYIFEDDLILIAEDGANLVLRNLPLAIVARGRFWVNNHAHILKPKSGNLDYLAGYLETINYQPWISGAAQPKLTKDRLMSIAISVAPEVEQFRISEYFFEKTTPLRQAILRTKQEISLIQEYRSRLIADIVTGKVDVREAARALPIAVEEAPPEPDSEDLDEETEMESESTGAAA